MTKHSSKNWTAQGAACIQSEQAEFWNGKRVYVTGHTGFKGSWLSMWLSSLGAHVYGYALAPETQPNLFDVASVSQHIARSTISDIRDREALDRDMKASRPEIVFHLAAQPLVLDSYAAPRETYEINVMGTVNVLDVARTLDTVRSIVVVTTDKVYENSEWDWGYREVDRLGGHDPYSNSKACCELVTDSYRRSFFGSRPQGFSPVGVATARAGNVIGGGDWAAHRLVPDFLRAASSKEAVVLRNPESIRPWQHVLEPLSGYMKLARLLWESPVAFSKSWNFGPRAESKQSVRVVIDMLRARWGEMAPVVIESQEVGKHEAKLLSLDCSQAESQLGWLPAWTLDEALDRVIEFWRAHEAGKDIRDVCLRQISAYSNTGVQREMDMNTGQTTVAA